MSSRMRLPRAEASAIRDRIMKEMLSLEEERMERMKGSEGDIMIRNSIISGSSKSAEDEGIIRRELNKVDPSAVVFSESWATKKVCYLSILSRFSYRPFLCRVGYVMALLMAIWVSFCLLHTVRPLIPTEPIGIACP